MPHNPLTYLLRKVINDAIRKENKASGNTYNEGRRNFLRDGLIATGGMTLLPSFLQAFPGGSNPSIAIVGAGIAGLNAAYQLKKMGLKATVYEASARTGGRMFTIKDKFGNGITTDIGGEYVDTTHEDILLLLTELNLSVYDLREDKLAAQTFYFDGKLLTEDDLKNAIQPFAKKIEKDVLSLPKTINYTTASSFEHLDKLSITEYIKNIGITGWLYNFLDVVLTREYGMEASEQSAINFLIMFSDPLPENSSYELFGDEHEVLKIKGGSQHLTNEIYEQVKPQVILNHKMVSIQKNKKDYTLGFTVKGNPKQVRADYVVLAIPFTILRKIKLNVPMPAEKRKCIDELGYGNSGKFIMGFKDKPWRKAGQKGYTFTDQHFGCGWDSSLMQSETEGSFTVFGGGDFMDDVCGKTTDALTKEFLPQLDTIYNGALSAGNDKTINFCWSKNAYSKAGYSSFKKGQWSTLAGWERAPVGNIYFAGEHTSLDFQGYMNGAAQTGRLAAEMIAEKIKQRES